MRGLFSPSAENKDRVYHRSEESRYVYRLHPNGKGATVASSVEGDYGFKRTKEGKETGTEGGRMAGLFAGELDENGRLTQGGYQKWVKEGDEERTEMRGTMDPHSIAERVGVPRPSILKDKPFDKTKAETLSVNFEDMVDQLVAREEFRSDPMLEKGEAFRIRATPAALGA